jgi:hypothetical protein
VCRKFDRQLTIGKKAEVGFDLKDLKLAQKFFEEKGTKTELICLNDYLPEGIEKEIGVKAEKAYILIIRNGVNVIADANALYKELQPLEWDTKFWNKGKVMNKKARHNLCVADFDQEPDYEEKKGRVISFDKLPITKKIRKALPNIIGRKGNKLLAELNHYYDAKTTYLSGHGDFERKMVIAVRLGATFRLCYQWFHNYKPISDEIEFILEHATIYIMSDKAVGSDWKKPSQITLRHSAGRKELTDWKPKKK